MKPPTEAELKARQEENRRTLEWIRQQQGTKAILRAK